MKNEISSVLNVLDTLLGFGRMFAVPFETPYRRAMRQYYRDRSAYRRSVWKMKQRGLVKITGKGGQKFLKITKKGELQVLMAKAIIPVPQTWDGKWRVIIFDIPEDYRDKRNLLRSLLKKNNFYMLQASVFINPYPLNRAAIGYLRETGLIEYIHIMRVDEIDDERPLLRRFKLRRS